MFGTQEIVLKIVPLIVLEILHYQGTHWYF